MLSLYVSRIEVVVATKDFQLRAWAVHSPKNLVVWRTSDKFCGKTNFEIDCAILNCPKARN